MRDDKRAVDVFDDIDLPAFKIDTGDVLNESSDHSKTSEETSNRGIYFSFEMRFFAILISFVLSLSASLFFLFSTLTKVHENSAIVKEKAYIDYEVCLKNNDFYETECLEKNKLYVSSLIKNIDAKFKYSFDADTQEEVNFDYDIVGRVVIGDVGGKNLFFDKEYPLLSNKQSKSDRKGHLAFEEKITIDYEEYDEIATKFRQKYGVDTRSYLEVVLNVHRRGANLDKDSIAKMKIPLSQTTFNIQTEPIDEENAYIIEEAGLKIDNVFILLLSIALLLISLIIFAKLVENIFLVTPRKSLYDRYVEKILREYDRFIVNTDTPPLINDRMCISVHNFTELLDARDTLKLPIKYFIITKHQKCIFYINTNDEIYLLKIKAVDLEGSSEK